MQAIGSQSIFYAELYAIAIVKNLLDELHLPINNRIEIFCDNQSVFELIYKNNNRDIHPILSSKCRELVSNYNIIVHKVKSHVSNDSIIGNDYADTLAGSAITIPFNHTIPLIWFSWLNSKTVHKNSRCCGQTVLWDTLDPG